MRDNSAAGSLLLILTSTILASTLFEVNSAYPSVPVDGTDATSPENANITNANITNAIITSTNITNANITNAIIIDSNLINSNMESAEHKKPADGLPETSEPRDAKSNITSANITNANITNATIIDSNIIDSSIIGSNLINSTMVPAENPQDNQENPQDNQENPTDGLPELPGSQDAVIKIKIEIDNKCHPEALCSGINSNNIFNMKVDIIGTGYSESIDPVQTLEDGLSYVIYPLEKNEIVEYFVTQTEQNFLLHPWYVQNTKKSDDCNSSISGNQSKECTITITVEDKPIKDFGIGYLHVKTNINNNCYPSSICNGIRPSNIFADHISTLEGTSYEEELIIPGSKVGWTVPFFLPRNESLVQYNVDQTWVKNKDVRLKPSEVSYTLGCQGTIEVNDTKYCTISNTFGQGNLDIAKLKVITQIETNETCVTTGSCKNIRTDDLFTDQVYTFNYNDYEEVFKFPASEGGWIVDFYPSRDGRGFVQYDVKQTLNELEGYRTSGSWNITYSDGCHGLMQAGENKICTIKNSWIKQPVTTLLSNLE